MTQAANPRLMLRAMVQAADAACAHSLQLHMLRLLLPFAPRPAGPPEVYWKLPQWVELTLDLAPSTHAAFEQVLAQQPLGWTDSGDDHDRSAVWNAAPGVTWLLPELMWAELILTLRPDVDQACATGAPAQTTPAVPTDADTA